MIDYDEDDDEYKELIRFGNNEYVDCLYHCQDLAGTAGIYVDGGTVYHVGRIEELLNVKVQGAWHPVAFIRMFSVDFNLETLDKTRLWTVLLSDEYIAVPIRQDTILRPAQLVPRIDLND